MSMIWQRVKNKGWAILEQLLKSDVNIHSGKLRQCLQGLHWSMSDGVLWWEWTGPMPISRWKIKANSMAIVEVDLSHDALSGHLLFLSSFVSFLFFFFIPSFLLSFLTFPLPFLSKPVGILLIYYTFQFCVIMWILFVSLCLYVFLLFFWYFHFGDLAILEFVLFILIEFNLFVVIIIINLLG